jgi:hypothetical protein
MHKDKKAVAKFLFCLGMLEGKTFQLYGRISEKVKWPSVKFSLLYMAYDCLKHFVILDELSKNFARPQVKTEDYQRILGDVWKTVTNLSKEILKMERIEEKEFLSLSDKLVNIYAVTRVQLKTLRFMTKEISEAYNVDMENLKDILELLISDEEIDTQVLMAIKDRLAERLETVADNKPAVKYTTPGKWYRSELAHAS